MKTENRKLESIEGIVNHRRIAELEPIWEAMTTGWC